MFSRSTAVKKAFVVAVVTYGTMAAANCLAQQPEYSPRIQLADSQRYLPIAPVDPGFAPPVKLGFYGHFDFRFGMVVDYVVQGTTAQRLGLETGDAIVSINGRPVRSASDYHYGLNSSHGLGWIAVRDVRTGQIVTLSLSPEPYPYSASSPVEFRTRSQ